MMNDWRITADEKIIEQYGLEHILDIHEDIQDRKWSCDLKNDVFSVLTQMLAGQKHFEKSSLGKIHFLQIQ